MKKFTFVLRTALLGMALTDLVNAEAAQKEKKKASEGVAIVYHVDTAASKATWVGTKKVGTHTGSVPIQDGEMEMKDGVIHAGKVVVNLDGLKNDDVSDKDYHKKLVDHLKGPDFFDTAKFPTAEFKITSYSEVHNLVPGQPNADVKGDLTIHGITKPAEIKMFVNQTPTGLTARGKLMVDRTIYGLKYNSKKFFDAKALGDKLINDTFEVDLNLVAKK